MNFIIRYYRAIPILLISILFAHMQESKILVLRNTSFIDVDIGVIVKNVDIVINESLIVEINEHSPDINYPDAQLFDLEGCFVIPGLIEGHTHISPIPEKSLTMALKRGVTSLRDMAGDGEYLKLLQDAVNSGDLLGPDIYFSALMGGSELILNDSRVKISTPPNYHLGDAPWMRLVDDNSDIPQIIKDAKDCGATGIKIYAYLPIALVKKLSDEANIQGLKVWAHWEVYPATAEEVVNTNVEVVSHIYFLFTPPDWNYKEGSKVLNAANLNVVRNEKLFATMRTNNIYLDPTIVVAREMFSSFTDRNQVDELNNAIYKTVEAAYESGVKIIAGTDIFLPKNESDKLPLHEEIEILVTHAGLSPIDAIRAATIYNAEMLGIENTHGTIGIGMVANLVVLDENPLNNIYNIEKVNFVIKNGRIIN